MMQEQIKANVLAIDKAYDDGRDQMFISELPYPKKYHYAIKYIAVCAVANGLIILYSEKPDLQI